MYLSEWRGRHRHDDVDGRDDGGFTLIELVVSIAIIGIIIVALTATVISYLKVSNQSSARLTESNDVQFAAAYWQKDVASIGVRSTSYNNTTNPPFVHSYPLLQSVNITPTCTLLGGTVVATLAWSSYSVTTPDAPTTVTVSYIAQPSGSVYLLVRQHCTGSTADTSSVVARNLASLPTLNCPGAASGCTGAGTDVPNVVTLTLTSTDPNNKDGSTYTATLTGERRQT